MAKILRITKAYVRTYRDSGQRTAYVEWVDTNVETGRTEGNEHGTHMTALLSSAIRNGLEIKEQIW